MIIKYNIKYRIKQTKSNVFYAQAKLSIFHRWGYINTYNYAEPTLHKFITNAKSYSNIEVCEKTIELFKEYVQEIRKYPKYIDYDKSK